MAEVVGFRDLSSGRDISPDSVILTGESNFSLFSSASASVDRCSFASDAPEQDSFASQHLRGPDPDPNKSALVHKNKAKVQKIDSIEAEATEDENVAVKSARNSFSRAVKECQDRRLRSTKVFLKKERRSSLDLNTSITSSSPRFDTTKKRTSAFPSPSTPNYRQTSIGVQKGWSSERVPHHTDSNRRSAAALLPYNNNGRTLPSKWEDAERWIFSPVSGPNQQPQRRPKSKSGPLGPPGVAYYQMFSPAITMFEGGHHGKVIDSSPFSTRGMMSDAMSVRHGGIGTEPCMARSISIHGCSEMVCHSTYPVQHDDSAANVGRVVSRRDMATQMSPESSSTLSSPKRVSSFSLATPSILPIVESHSSKQDMRDVAVDERVTVTRWSRKNRAKNPVDKNTKALKFQTATWEVSSQTSKTSISKIEREEAKITAWENLQKAKAEAAIRKMEMKLEKKRSSSMDKIMKKLKNAQKKGQDMRRSMITNQHITKSSERALSFRRARPVSSLSGCFTCHAF